MIRYRLIAIGRLAALLSLVAALAMAQGFRRVRQAPAVAAEPPAIRAGAALFAQHCASCHGPDAEGGMGPDLTTSPVVAGDVNGNAIGQVVLNGRPGTAMPAFSFSQEQIQNLASFLHNQAKIAAAAKGNRKGVSAADLAGGDAAAGKAFFDGAGGCSSCHSVTGDLAGIASRMRPLQLEEQMLSPRPPRPPGSFFGGGNQSFAKVTVTLPSGRVVRGTLAFRDNFSIGLTDAAGHYHSWPLSAVRYTITDPVQAHVRLLAKYTDADIHNLMAYLQTLTGPSAAPAPSAPPATGTAAPEPKGATAAVLLHPGPDAWPSYHGNYNGQRHSPLTQITPANVRNLGLAWMFPTGMRTGIKSSPLEVDGILYFSVPDNVWAVDARTGHLVWHYTYPPNQGSHIGNRGVGMYNNWLYFMSPDGHLVSLDATTGKVRWIVEVVDYTKGYWTTTAPLVIGDHVIVGESGDFDNLQGFVRSVDAVTGATQWQWNSTPPPGTPNAATGGNAWMTGTYDPSLNLFYVGTGNPTPVLEGQTRPGDDLYTCSIVALNPDTGKLVWAFQPSPHDTHDWDAVETPVLVNGTFNGQPRKMLMQASRNGYFFVLDRTNGKDLLTTPFGPVNWASGLNAKGEPIPNPEKEPARNGRLVAPAEGGLANYRSPSFDPATGLFVVDSSPSYGIYFEKKADGTLGWAGADYGVYSTSVLEALDYHTGKPRWQVPWNGGTGAGVLTTASGLIFTGDAHDNTVALDTATGKILWHAGTGAGMASSPISYELDGRQYVVTSSGGVLFAWALPRGSEAP